MKVNNDAIGGDIIIELNWYRLGHQFADLSDMEQANFFIGMAAEMDEGGLPPHKLNLDGILEELAERLRRET
jgi:hypothetical protein